MMLPIRQQLNKLGSLNRTQRAILIEICELAENGGHGACTASNEHFMERIVTSDRTTSRTLRELERLGLLLVSGATNRRKLNPSDLTRSCYNGSAIEVLSAVAALDTALIDSREPQLVVAANGEVTTAKLPPKLPPLLPRMAVVDDQTTAKTTAIGDATTAIRGSELPPSVVSTTAIGGSPYKETSSDEQKNEQELLSRLAEAEKKIADLKEQLQAANATCVRRTDENLAVKGQFEKSIEVWKCQTKDQLLAQWKQIASEPTVGSLLHTVFKLRREELAALAEPVAKTPSPAKQADARNRQALIDRYFAWYQERNHNMKPVLQVQDAAAALKIFKYFRSQEAAQTDEDALQAFEMLLSKWNTLDPFSQKRQTLNEIYNSLTNLITQIAHGQPTSNRAQQLGLVDTNKSAAAAARRKELGLD